MNHKYKRLIGDIGIFALGALGSKLVLFLLLPIYTNILSNSEYGIADLVFTVGDLVLPFISLAIFNGLLRYGLIKGKRQNSLLIATVIFVIGSLITVLLTPLAGLYAPISDWKWYMCAYVIVHFARSNALVFLKIKDKNKAYSLLSITQALLLVGFNVVFLIIFKMGIQGYLLSTILSNAALDVIAFFIGGMGGDLRQSSFDKPLLKEMVVFSIPFIFNDLSWWVIHSTDKIMIEWMIGGAALGIYTAASKIPSLVNALTGIFSQAWGLASIKEHDSTNDSKFYSNVFRYYTVVIFGATILLVAVTKPFMSVYVGKAFSESWHYVPLLLVGAAFSAISVFASGMFGALKQSMSIMTTTLAAGAANIIINYLLIQVIGIYGAVVGTVSAYFIVALFRLLILKRKVDVNFQFGRLGLLTAIAVTQATLVGIGFHIAIVSAVAIVLFVILTRKDIIMVCKQFKKAVLRFKH